MKAINTYLKIIGLVFILSSTSLLAQWEQFDGPKGGYVKTLAFSGDTVVAEFTEFYRSPNMGVFLSSNNGTYWKYLGLSGSNILSLTLKGSQIYAVDDIGRLFSYTGIDTNWARIGGLGNNRVSSFVVNGSNMLIVANGLIFSSSDNGSSWSQMKNGIEKNTVYSLAYNGSYIFAAINGGIYRSTDYGASWELNYKLEGCLVNQIKISGDNVFATYSITNYASRSDGCVVVSTNNGANWKWVGTDLPNRPSYNITSDADVRHIAIDGSNLLVATFQEGIYFSSNSGEHWKRVGLYKKNINCIAIKDTQIYAGADPGLYFTPDFGTNWTGLNSSVLKISSFAFAANQTNIFVPCYLYGFFLSTDEGITWNKTNSTNSSPMSIAVSGNKIYLGADRGIFLSTNSGNNWTLLKDWNPTAHFEGNSVVLIALSGNYIFANVLEKGLYFSIDNGISWRSDVASLNSAYLNTSFATVGNNVYRGTWNKGIFFSSDSGTNWTEINKGLTNLNVHCLEVKGTTLFAGTDGGAFVSSDNGLNWNAINNGLSDTLTVTSFVIRDTNILAGTENGVFFSSNDGEGWKSVGLTNKKVNLYFGGNKIYATEYYLKNFYKANIDDLISISDTPISSSPLSLFPNPAQNSLNICLDKVSEFTSSVRVLDVCGRTIAESQIPAGSKEMTLDLRDLPVGIFLLNVMSGNSIITQKFAVCR